MKDIQINNIWFGEWSFIHDKPDLKKDAEHWRSEYFRLVHLYTELEKKVEQK